MRFALLRNGMLLLGLIAWVTGLGAQQVHELLVLHVVCPEHNEVLEVRAADVGAAPSPGEELRADHPTAHDHGCQLMAALVSPAPPVHAVVWARPTVWDPPEARGAEAEAPRGPPLAYAPKTSPPSA